MLGISVKELSKRPKPLAALVLCTLSAAVAWLAWRPAPLPPRPNAVAAPHLDPNTARLQPEVEAAKQRAEAARPFILEASKNDKEHLQSLMTAYSTALKPVREPPLLDLSTIADIEQLSHKKQIVQTFIKANDALRSFLDRREESYSDTLLKLGLPSKSLEFVMEAYRKTAAQPTALVLKMRNDDDKMGTALLGMLALLEANWGQWKFNPAKQKVEFADHATQEKFLDLKEALDEASLEQMSCQIKLAALETSE